MPRLAFSTPTSTGNRQKIWRKNSENRMFRIQRVANGEVVFTLSGRMDEEDIAELEYSLDRNETDAA
jgi:hypothetical protein